MVDFSDALAAGLTQGELAKVLGVSRVTINMWVNGKMKPHRLHSEQVLQRMELLRQALKAGKIPKKTGPRKPRHHAIEEALKSMAVTV